MSIKRKLNLYPKDAVIKGLNVEGVDFRATIINVSILEKPSLIFVVIRKMNIEDFNL
jgi:hypothetical protein